ncbi:MAG: Flp pilus assembly protein CpaB [Pseudomonadota bacterium]
MKGKRALVLGLALVAAVVAAFLAKNLVSKKEVKVVTKAAEKTVQVLVAARDIPLGTPITEKGLQWQVWPKKASSSKYILKNREPDAMTKFAKAMARTGLTAGEPVLKKKLILPDQGGFMAAILPKGMRAISFKISADTGAGGFILPNDKVDVLLTRKVQTAATPGAAGNTLHVTETVLTNVRVLAIDQTFRENEKGEQVVVGKTATVELRPEQAEVLELADSMGALSLTLRSIAENSGKLGDDGPKAAKGFAKGGSSRGIAVIRYGSSSILHGGQ